MFAVRTALRVARLTSNTPTWTVATPASSIRSFIRGGLPTFAAAGRFSRLSTGRSEEAIATPYSAPPAKATDGACTPPEAAPRASAGAMQVHRDIVARGARVTRRANHLIQLLSPGGHSPVRPARRVAAAGERPT